MGEKQIYEKLKHSNKIFKHEITKTTHERTLRLYR